MSIFHRSRPEDAGSVSGAPNLPEGFTDTFASRYVDTGELRPHAVIGGDGPPLLLVHGWPETWNSWRLDVQSVVIPGTGHFLAEESPGELPAALTPFLAPYRDASGTAPATAAATH